MKEKLLFAVHLGSVGDRLAGIIIQNHCLPIACSHASWAGKNGDLPYTETGIAACWEATADVEEFFTYLDLASINNGLLRPGDEDVRPNGLHVYEVEYNEESVSDNEEFWLHLSGGTLRRPTTEELEPLTRGQAPWGGLVL
jgi:hypothetical protein